MSDEVDRGEKLDNIDRVLRDPTTVLRQIGAVMVSESQAAFRNQRFGDVPWRERAPVNVFGLLADLAAGKEPPARRFERRPALRDTGRLQQSIAFRILAGAAVVEVGSNLPYSGVQHRGGEVESVPITKPMQAALYRWMRKGANRDKGKAVGWLLNKKFTGKKLKGTVPARPFVGVTQQTIADVKELIGVAIVEA